MSASEVCNLKRWASLCQNLGMTSDPETYGALIKAHAEPHRAYHTLDHIAACLRHLDEVRGQTECPDEIEMALWFHDAVYDPFSATNEEDSAEWAADWLQDKGLDKSVYGRIADYILATKSHDTPASVDGRFMLDIDLSILGTPVQSYDQFEIDVRREYRRIPRFIFRKKRKAILEGFLTRGRIYGTEFFYNKLETQARINLTRAINNL